jgi:hypothetical protein
MMAGQGDASKTERLAEFLARLSSLPRASDFDETYDQLCSTLNDVENDMTSIPYDPGNWQNDGRMYPLQRDNLRPVPGRSDVHRLRSRGHNTFIGDNGAITIEDLSGKTLLSKPGADGTQIWS